MPFGIADFGGKGLNTGKKMNSNAESATQAADMIARLGWLFYSQGFVCGLTAAQWTALRYFARANCFSRTVSAFADYHATTRGTASQTVKGLVICTVSVRRPPPCRLSEHAVLSGLMAGDGVHYR